MFLRNSPLARIARLRDRLDKHLITASTIALVAGSGSVLHRNRVHPNSSKNDTAEGIPYLSLPPFPSITQAVPKPVLAFRIVRILTCSPFSLTDDS